MNNLKSIMTTVSGNLFKMQTVSHLKTLAFDRLWKVHKMQMGKLAYLFVYKTNNCSLDFYSSKHVVTMVELIGKRLQNHYKKESPCIPKTLPG